MENKNYPVNKYQMDKVTIKEEWKGIITFMTGAQPGVAQTVKVSAVTRELLMEEMNKATQKLHDDIETHLHLIILEYAAFKFYSQFTRSRNFGNFIKLTKEIDERKLEGII